LHGHRSLRALLALADQAVVSGVSFLTMIVIGRTCGKIELGIYSLGMSLVVLAIAAQQSLISVAHTVYSVRLEGESGRQYNGAVAVQFVALSVLVAVSLGCVALGCRFWMAGSETTRVFSVLLFVCPCILLREFARRFEFARFGMFRALILDAVIALLLVVILGLLAYSGGLSGTTGLLAVGGACAAAGGLWYWVNQSQFQLSGANLRAEFKRGWRFGRWVFGGQFTSGMLGVSIQWITAAMIGEAAVGVYSACMMLVLFANPIVLGLQNMLSPSIAKAMQDGGREQVRLVVAKSTAALTSIMIVYVFTISFLGDFFLVRLYDESFIGNRLTVALLGWGALASAIGDSSSHGLRAIERPEFNFLASVLALVAAVLTALVCIPKLGVAGAALGFAINFTIRSSVLVVCFIVVSRPEKETPS
jgi:O-antigen/teichoic acid export membrane protein